MVSSPLSPPPPHTHTNTHPPTYTHAYKHTEPLTYRAVRATVTEVWRYGNYVTWMLRYHLSVPFTCYRLEITIQAKCMLLFRTKISDAWVKIKTFIKIIIIKNAFFDKIGEKRKNQKLSGVRMNILVSILLDPAK